MGKNVSGICISEAETGDPDFGTKTYSVVPGNLALRSAGLQVQTSEFQV
jgi:hypothetical protein